MREDPVREGLLFAGTEYGMFVSLDDGGTWQEFQQNLAVTPVTDIKVVRGDLAISTMGRSFWVLDNVTTLRQRSFDSAGESPLVFRPNDTIRYRNVYTGESANGVPDFPPPAAVIDYYLPEGFDGTVRLEIVDAAGDIVNAYESVAEDEEAEETGNIVEEDMASSRTIVIADQSLSAEPGMNRFRWDMTHFGAWDEDEEKRFRQGPIARPGDYTVRLLAGEEEADAELTLLADPRVLAQGTSLEDIGAQVAFQLIVVDLLSEVRQFEQEVAKEHEDLEGQSADLSEEEAARLLVVKDVLDQVRTADMIYPQPMLADQVLHLYQIVSGADQSPGVEAADRYAALAEAFAALRERYAAPGS